jgi:cyclic pyranopterin phosphate synthase
MTSTSLTDQIGRRIRKLRVSLVDACNFRCFYCMPEDSRFMHPSKLMSVDEIITIVGRLVDFGIEELRLTGGEPTLRREFAEIVRRISDLPVRKIGLTTNGYLLSQYLEMLKASRCIHLNVSMDSLQKNKFNQITRRDSFDRVYAAVMQAREMNFDLKINCVLMKGVNDDEIMDFVGFSERTGIPVRFLELMRIGQACNNQTDQFMTADQSIELIRAKRQIKMMPSPLDSTSFNFLTEGGGQVGFIASESKPFCGTCSRWRLSADGFLRACLMSEAGVSIRNLPAEDYPQVFSQLFKMKPTGRIYEIHQDMNQIGG